MAQKRDEGGKFVKGEVDHRIDWNLNELKFETPEGTAVYKYLGTEKFVREIRKTVQKNDGSFTWTSDGFEEEPMPGDCMGCGLRLFVCDTHPIRSDYEVGDHIAHIKKTMNNQPPEVYCGSCIVSPAINPEVVEAVEEQKRQDTRVKTAQELHYEDLTRRLGGTR